MAVVPGAKALHLWEMGGHKDDLMQASAPLFFGAHHSDSRWLKRLNSTRLQTDWGPDRVSWQIGAELQVPAAWTEAWLLELSPLPVLLPSVGCLGHGASVPWPAAVVRAARGAPLFARLTPRCQGEYRPVLAVIVNGMSGLPS